MKIKLLLTIFLGGSILTSAQVQKYISTTYAGGSGSIGTIITGKTDGASNEVLFNFPPPPDGMYPTGNLVKGSDGDFYGICELGGQDDNGTIFKITSSGAFTKLHNFKDSTDGSFPRGGLIQASDGSFYGMGSYGGTNSLGTIFKITSSGVFTKLYDLTFSDGRHPEGSLLEASDGNFYGMCRFGGSNDKGTIFKITTDGILTVIFNFDEDSGYQPLGNLIQGTDGNFYGMCRYGGFYTDGTIFKITPAGSYTVLRDFFDLTEGGYPEGSLVQGTDGDFYGLTSGYSNNIGAFFKITSSGTFTKLKDFSNELYLRGGGLIQGIDGDFYGTYSFSGFNTISGIFKITPTGTLTSIYNLDFHTDGGYIPGSLIQNSDSSFYGMCTNGGRYGFGSIFKITPSGEFTNLRNLPAPPSGYSPAAGLTEGKNSQFYGTTLVGGANNFGTIFKIDLNGTFTKLHDLSATSDGAGSYSNLTEGTDGNFYGVLEQGGINNYGTIFKITPDGSFTKLIDMSTLTGTYPDGALMLSKDGNFYGTCSGGYANFNSTYNPSAVFKITPNGEYTKLKELSTLEGINLNGGLIEGSDGNFYGMCQSGGTHMSGTIFKITNGGEFTKLRDLDSTDGTSPFGKFVIGRDGDFYGTCSYGGDYKAGTIFKISSSGTFQKVHDLIPQYDGAYPMGSLVMDSYGNFYGTCMYGGPNGVGTVFKIKYNGEFITLIENFGIMNAGSLPFGDLTLIKQGESPPPVTSIPGETFTVTGITNILTNNNSAFEVYPNPSEGSFILTFNSSFQETEKICSVYNSIGEYISTMHEGEAWLPKGLYLLRCKGQSKKIVIE